MILSGIADEAGHDLATQIAAHQAIGWTHIDVRRIDEGNLAEVDDAAFDRAYGQLQEAGMQVACFASRIGCGARDISDDFSEDQADLARAIPRMQRLGCRYIRCMSWPNRAGKDDGYWRDEAIRRLSVLSAMAADAGVALAHENCSGWGGHDAARNLQLFDAVDSAGFELIFDTANNITKTDDASWDFWQGIKTHVTYIHVKDKQLIDDRLVHCWPGEGRGRVREVLSDALASGFDGPIAIEPHMTGLKKDASPADKLADYVAYGRRLNQLIDEIKAELATGAES